jgi:sensor histidine kinase YesM
MAHPVLSYRHGLLIYFGLWLLLALLHAAMLYQFYDAPALMAGVDGFIYSLMYFVISLGLWYAVKFSDLHKQSYFQVLINHVSGLVLTLLLWMALGYISVTTLPMQLNDYEAFFRATLALRIIFGSMIYLMVVLFYYVALYFQNFREKLLQESELKAIVQSTEMDFLKSQINPHFLFNSLNSIGALTMAQPAKAHEMIVKLSGFLRSSLDVDRGKTTLEKELQRINDYLDIEKVRFEDRLKVSANVAEKCMQASLPSMILQPVIENVVKHGVSESVEQVKLDIVADCFHGYLKVQVSNNYDPDYTPDTRQGIGLANIRKRMGLVYGRSDLVNVHAGNQTFKVVLDFPQ